MCAYRVAAFCRQLVDTYVHAPADPGVDELLELALHLLAKGVLAAALHLLLRWQARAQRWLSRWLARHHVPRLVVRA